MFISTCMVVSALLLTGDSVILMWGSGSVRSGSAPSGGPIRCLFCVWWVWDPYWLMTRPIMCTRFKYAMIWRTVWRHNATANQFVPLTTCCRVTKDNLIVQDGWIQSPSSAKLSCRNCYILWRWNLSAGWSKRSLPWCRISDQIQNLSFLLPRRRRVLLHG